MKWGGESCVELFFGNMHAPPLAWTTPPSLASLQSHAGAAEYSGSLGEKHTLCTAGPHQPRPEGTTLKDMENWGRELPSFPLLGQAEQKEGTFPNCLCLSERRPVWLVLLRENTWTLSWSQLLPCLNTVSSLKSCSLVYSRLCTCFTIQYRLVLLYLWGPKVFVVYGQTGKLTLIMFCMKKMRENMYFRERGYGRS